MIFNTINELLIRFFCDRNNNNIEHVNKYIKYLLSAPLSRAVGQLQMNK